MAAQQSSHDLDDADQYEALFPAWLERDVSAEHPTGVLTADCGIHRSITTAHGINLVPPEAL
jgi:hypothetical protein